MLQTNAIQTIRQRQLEDQNELEIVHRRHIAGNLIKKKRFCGQLEWAVLPLLTS